MLVFIDECFAVDSVVSLPADGIAGVRFCDVDGVDAVDREVLSRRTADYQNWVEAFARNHHTPLEWAEKGVRKEDYVARWLRSMVRAQRYGVYFIFIVASRR